MKRAKHPPFPQLLGAHRLFGYIPRDRAQLCVRFSGVMSPHKVALSPDHRQAQTRFGDKGETFRHLWRRNRQGDPHRNPVTSEGNKVKRTKSTFSALSSSRPVHAGLLAGTLAAVLLLGYAAAWSADAGFTSRRKAQQKASRDTAVANSIAELTGQLENTSDSARVLTDLGYLYASLGDADKARWAFRQAIASDSSLARAHAGLGQLYLESYGNKRGALQALQTAIRLDSTMVESYYHAARAHLGMNQKRLARKAADAAIRQNPTYAPPYRILAKLYQEEENLFAAQVYYKKYLEQNPDDQTAAYEFAMDLIKNKQFAEVEELAARMEDVRGLPLLAQALIQRRDYEGAIVSWARYLDSLPPEEQALFDDISLVGLPHEVRAYASTTPETREAFLRSFWLRKDPFKTSGGAMRRSEHYRRAWHARSFYGKKEWPWDRRGEIYIRYGEPDYRSSSREINAQVPLDVQRLQDMMAYQLYGEKALSMTFVGPVYPIRNARTVEETLKHTDYQTSSKPIETFTETDTGLEFYKPVSAGSDFSTHPWETWIYTDVDGGMEIAFTDEFYSGRYDYAPIPTLSGRDIDNLTAQADGRMTRMVSRLNQLSPAARIDRLSYKEPERFDISYLEPLDFYYETLTFRGDENEIDVQVNIAIPIDAVALPTDHDTTIVVERRVALFTDRETDLQRRRQQLAIPISDAGRGKGLLAVDRVDMAARPGEYQLAIEASRTETEMLQVYRQTISLPDYHGDKLILSDIQIAKRVKETEEASRSKFARGGWDILPAPARAFPPGAPLFVYFEIYNLTRDTFGNTRYEVAYEVRAKSLKTEGSPATFLPRIRKRTGESIEVRYEQLGTETTVNDFVELDLAQARPGAYVLTMNVKDLNSGEVTRREGAFRVSGAD